MKKIIITILLLAAAGGGGYAAWRRYRTPAAPPAITTAALSRGDIVETVGATGTLQAVTTVQVGTQVSGTLQTLTADFNALVKRGQVLARLDPSLFQTQVEQSRANLVRAQADLERLRVAQQDATTKLQRARELSARNLIPRSELDTADVNVRSADAQIRSQQAQVTQAQAALNQSTVNLEHTVITSPIDGLVISRNVDVGQTVAASMQAPTLYVLAADLTKMQVVASVDESDVGRIRPGQSVTFRVDAYPTGQFRGTVSQVRLEPKVQQNVVTYATVIDVPNDDLRLKPGMTANVTIEIARATNALRIANAALRFRPTTEMYTALGQTPPAPTQIRVGGGGRGAATTQGAAPAAPAASTAAAPATAPSGSTPTGRTPQSPAGSGATEDRAGAPVPQDRRRGDGASFDPEARARFQARLDAMSPEERAAFAARSPRGPRGADVPSGASGASGARGARDADTRTRRRPAGAAATTGRSASTPQAATIDALFAPLPRTETMGRAFLSVSGKLQPVVLRLGISDGQFTEVLGGTVQEGTAVVTGIALATATVRPTATTPFGQGNRGGFPGGGFPGGGPGGGGNVVIIGGPGGPGGGGGGGGRGR